MNTQIAHDMLLPACMAIFPSSFNSPQARAMILAICLQESDFQHRQQLIGNHRHWWESIKGPARGYAQFEMIGVSGVLEHPASRPIALSVLRTLGYPADVTTIHKALTHNDILMVAFARLALWRLPEKLPGYDEPGLAWAQYLAVWAPGKPKPERWKERFDHAWDIVSNNQIERT